MSAMEDREEEEGAYVIRRVRGGSAGILFETGGMPDAIIRAVVAKRERGRSASWRVRIVKVQKGLS